MIESPIFIYAIKKVNDRFVVISNNDNIPKEVVIANIQAEIKLLEKEFLNSYKSNGN